MSFRAGKPSAQATFSNLTEAKMDETLAAMVESHRAIVSNHGHDIRHAPTDSLQIVLLAAILDALTGATPATNPNS